MRTQQGNVLFLILIAVVLFAALSYAVTQSSRGGGNADRETAQLSASQAVQYASALDYAITKLTLMNGCTETSISFENSTVTGYANTEDPSSTTACQIFHADGAGMSWASPPPGVNDGTPYFFNKTVNVYETNSTTYNGDLIMFLFNVSESFCDAVNSGVGITGTPEDSGNILKTEASKFDGEYLPSDGLKGSPTNTDCDDPGIETPNLCGVPTACFIEGDTGERHFMHVLISRE